MLKDYLQNKSGLNEGVLVLNQSWAAIDIFPLWKALSKLVSGEAKVAEQEGETWLTFGFEEWCDFGQVHNQIPAISTPKLQVPKPKIIILIDSMFHRERMKVAFNRSNIFIRDNYTCQYCGEVFRRPELNLDHVVPRQQGGRTNWTNIVCSCYECNTRKANRTPAQANMKLLKIPKEPKQVPVRMAHASWHDFLSQAYWCVPLKD